jgi:adenylate cyclase
MERRLTAILAADVVGYSRLMGADEAGTLAALKSIRTEFIDAKIAEHQGRVVKLTGDGILAEFPSVVSAVACATELQREMRRRSATVPTDRRIEFRVGVNVGDVIVEGDDIYGDGVNVAVRLESIAEPGGVTISQSVREHVGNRLAVQFQDRGEQNLKNIEKPVRVYNVLLDEPGDAGINSKTDDRPSIAVLPFNNMSGDPEQEYFSDGITEDIITDLSKVSGLSVIARHSAFSYKGRAVKVQQIGRELGVNFVVEGSVRKAGTRVRVTGQLVDCKDGSHLWAERFDRNLTDIFAIQDEITHAIVDQLKVKLLPQEKKSIEQVPTQNIEAYTYYLRGREFLHRLSKHNLEIARRMFARAVELDPQYARAYAGLADCDSHLHMIYFVKAPINRILATSAKALELDNSLAEAHASRGVAFSVAGRIDEAHAEFEKAIALDLNSFEAHFFYARFSFQQGKIERAAGLYERAAEIKPGDYQCQCLLGGIYQSLDRERESKEASRRGVELAERELAAHPEDSRPAQLGACCLMCLGENDRAREWVARAVAIDPDDNNTRYNAACTYALLGEVDAALDLLERSLPNMGPGHLNWAKHDPDLEVVRKDPRFQQLIERLEKRNADPNSSAS